MGRRTGGRPEPEQSAARAAVAQILAADGAAAGAGFLAGDGLLVTCAHVLRAAGHGPGDDGVRVRFPQAEGAPRATGAVDAEAWRDPEGDDIAVVRLAGPPPGVPVLAVGSAQGFEGQAVWSFGFPDQAHAEGRYASGTLQGRLNAGGRSLLQLDGANAVAQGFSGGPVLDVESGLVIGMTTEITAPDRHGRGVNVAYVTPGETLRAVQPALAGQDVCPYLDLRPFTERESGWFHGRDDARDKVVEVLGRHRGVLLQGPSGAGKSSLVQAGVRPALPDGWLALTVRAGQDWAGDLERQGLPGIRTAGLLAAVRQRLEPERAHVRLLLVVDQFEELLSTAAEPGGAQPDAGADAVRQLTEVIHSYERAVVLLVMRVDFYPRLHMLAPELLEAVRPGQVDVFGTLGAGALRDMVVKPARSVGLRFEAGLPEVIVDEVLAAHPGGAAEGRAPATLLPLLEKTLTLLWENRSDNRLTLNAYQAIGRFGGSLDRWYDRAFEELGPGRRPVAQRVLSALVRHDEAEQAPDVRQARSLRALRDLTEDSAFDEVLAVLVQHRLVTTHTARDGRHQDQPMVELIHDFLVRHWEDLRRWVLRDAAFDAWLRRVELQQSRWEATLSPDDLLRPSELDAALEWAAQKRVVPERASEFLRRSERHHKDGERRRRRNRRTVIGVLSLLTVVLTVTTGFLVEFWVGERQARQEVEERELIATTEGLAAKAEQLRATNPRLSLQLGVAAENLRSTAKVRASLVNSLATTRLAGTFPGTALGFVDGDSDRLLLHRGAADGTDEATGPGGEKAQGDHLTVRSVSGDRPDRTVYRVDDPAVSVLAAGPDGRRVLVRDATARRAGVREVPDGTGRPVTSAAFGTQALLSGAAFAGDGSRVVLGHLDGTMTSWDLSRPDRPRMVGGHVRLRPPPEKEQVPTWSVQPFVSPRGDLIAVPVERAVTLWTAGVPHRKVAELRLPALEADQFLDPYTISQVAFSRDGRTVAVAAVGGVVVWDVTRPERPGLLQTLADARHAAAFGPDGRTLATVADDGTTLWDISDRSRARRTDFFPAPEESDPVAVRFAPDGQRVVVQHTGSGRSYAALWNLRQPGWPRRLGGELPSGSSAMAVRPDGRVLVTAGPGRRVECWDISAPSRPVRIATVRTRLPHEVTALAFRPDGEELAVGGSDGRTQLWDVRDVRRPVRRSVSPRTTLGAVTALGFGPDGRTLHISDNAYVIRWRAGAPSIPLTMGTVFPQFVERIAVSGTTGTMARVAPYQPFTPVVRERGAMVGGPVQLWPAGETGPLPGSGADELPGPGNVGSAVEFHPAGEVLAVGSPSGTLTLWQVTGAYGDNRRLGLPVRAHSSAISTIAFAPDGATAATGATDGTIVIWTPHQDGPLNLSGPASAAHTDRVRSMAFTSGSRTLITNGADGAVRLWHVGALAEARRAPTRLACALVGEGLDEIEWASFVPSLPYRDTCP
ncbi:nSTAND1 domain-containing NTPase [Streptomyces cinereospinus]|uniref:Trypsin-like peptidase domain-containing protein n=1 Tax=Streptomyces cinereospinus TaxID=285561 RepID=A0ABV5MWN0_9ACTN